MVWSFLLNVPFAFGILIAYLYAMGSITDAVATPTGFPTIYVFQNATGSVRGATALSILLLVLLSMITASTMASTIRQACTPSRNPRVQIR